jgi:hypothetical protein
MRRPVHLQRDLLSGALEDDVDAAFGVLAPPLVDVRHAHMRQTRSWAADDERRRIKEFA